MATTKVEFKVRLENVELSKAQQTAMQKEINAVVTKYALKLSKKTDVWGSYLKIDPEWLGKWLRKFASIDELKRNAASYKQERIG
jgi:hypothetical protein